MSADLFQLAPGTRDDLAGGRSLGELHPYFGADGAALRFVELAFGPRLPELAKQGGAVRCLDVGGGEGMVAEAFLTYCKSNGIDAISIVLDQNPRFLKVAAERGLEVMLQSIEDFCGNRSDCAILRFVNHYNNEIGQARIASSLSRCVRDGGVLAAQIETGDEATCALLGDIAGLLSGDAPGRGRHWMTQPAFEASYRAVGFEVEAVHGAELERVATPGERLAEAWDRVAGPQLWSALAGDDRTTASHLLESRREFIVRAHDRLAREPSGAAIRTTQPLLVLRRVET